MSEPMDPEELHVLSLHMTWAPYIDVEDPKDFRIPVWVPFRALFVIFVCQGHNVWMGMQIDWILGTA
jgi:hypothetical protein